MFARDRPTHICVLLMIVNEISNWGKIKKWLTYYCQNICWFYWWLIDFGFTNSINSNKRRSEKGIERINVKGEKRVQNVYWLIKIIDW